MVRLSISRAIVPLLLLVNTFAEKQIKLEDIERDNLTAAEQAKVEKHYQKYGKNYQPVQYQYQPQYQTQYQSVPQYTADAAEYQTAATAAQYQQSQYQPQSAPEYQPQASTQYSSVQPQSTPQYQSQASPQFTQEAALSYQEPSVTYQSHNHPQSGAGHSHYSPYVLPFNPNQLLSMIQGNYNPLQSNSLETSQSQHSQSSAQHPFLQYFSQQLQPVAIPTGPRTSSSQQQPIVMAYSSPSLAAFQQQAAAYYQGLPQYLQQLGASTGGQQYHPYFLQQQGQQQSHQQSTPLMYTQPQYVVPPFQALKIPPATTPGLGQYSNQAYRSFATPSQYTSQASYSQTEAPATIVSSSLKPSVLSQQQQYLQSVATVSTPSPLAKYNSPQYLAQNYNTISSSFSKSAYSKPTAAIKVATQGGFLPNNPTVNYQYSRSVSG